MTILHSVERQPGYFLGDHERAEWNDDAAAIHVPNMPIRYSGLVGTTVRHDRLDASRGVARHSPAAGLQPKLEIPQMFIEEATGDPLRHAARPVCSINSQRAGSSG